MRSVRWLVESAMMAGLFALGLAGGMRMARQHVAFVAAQNAAAELRMRQVDLDRPTLGQLLHGLSTEQAVPIQVDWPELAKAGVTPQTELPDFHLHNVTLRQVCSLVSIANSTICFSSFNGTIHVTTHDGALATQTIQIYDVSDILQNYQAWKQEPAPEFPDFGSSQVPTQPPTPSEALMTLTSETVAPDTWIDSGGTTGRLNCLGGRLFVLQAPEQQDEVQSLLDQLRDAARQQASQIPRLAHFSFEGDPLQREVPALRLGRVSIRDAAKVLRSASRVNLNFDWEALHRDAGIDPNSPAPAVLPAGQLIDAVTFLLSSGQSKPKLRMVRSGHFVLVSTEQQLGTELPTLRIYPFSDTPRHLAMRPRLTVLLAEIGIEQSIDIAQSNRLPEADGVFQFWPGWIAVKGTIRAHAAVAHLLSTEGN